MAALAGLDVRLRRHVEFERAAAFRHGHHPARLHAVDDPQDRCRHACTAGLPAVYTRILTLRALPTWQYYGYLALYDLAYVFDDGVMLAIAVVTLGRRKLQERAGRWLKLVSGIVMLVLGAALVTGVA